MGHLSNRLKFTKKLLKDIIKESKKLPKNKVILNFVNGESLSVGVSDVIMFDRAADYTHYNNKIRLYPHEDYLYRYLFILLFIYPSAFISFFLFLMLFLIFYSIFMYLCISKNSEFSKNIKLFLYRRNTYKTILKSKISLIHELTHFYDRRIDSLNYVNNFIRPTEFEIDIDDKTYYNTKSEINAHITSVLYSIENKKFKNFKSFYKKIKKRKRNLFKYITEENKEIIEKQLKEYYEEQK